MKYFIILNGDEFGAYLAHKWKSKTNYYLFTEGIGVIIFFFILLLMCIVGIFYVFFQQPPFEDPIEGVKKTYLTIQLGSTIILVALLFLVSAKGRSVEAVKNNIIKASAVIGIAIVLFAGMKINLDKQYQQDTFKQFFIEYCEKNGIGEKQRLKTNSQINIAKMKIEEKNLENYYIEESMHSYQAFSIKYNANLGLLMILLIVSFFMVYQSMKTLRVQKRLEKDDLILEDDETNVKY